MDDEELFTEATLGIIESWDRSKFNVAIGIFQNYSDSVESDTTGLRFCDLKLHYKDDDGNDIGLRSVPLMYIGNKDFIVDFELTQGDELIVLWSDRSLEQWKNTPGPQKLRDPVKDSFNYGMAIPVCSVHDAGSVTGYIKATASAIDIKKSGTTMSIANSGVTIV